LYVENAQVVESGSDVGVLGAERLLLNGKHALVERLNLGVAALACIESAQNAESGADVGVLGAERLLLHC
jgi:hypothetical protein